MTRIHTSMKLWQRSWIGGKLSRSKIMVSTLTTNKNTFSVCYFSGWNAREESPGRTCPIDSNHGSKKVRSLFASTVVGKRSNFYRGHKVLLAYDSRISTPQSPVGKGAGLGSRIRNKVGGLNCISALKCVRGQECLHATHGTPEFFQPQMGQFT